MRQDVHHAHRHELIVKIVLLVEGAVAIAQVRARSRVNRWAHVISPCLEPRSVVNSRGGWGAARRRRRSGRLGGDRCCPSCGRELGWRCGGRTTGASSCAVNQRQALAAVLAIGPRLSMEALAGAGEVSMTGDRGSLGLFQLAFVMRWITFDTTGKSWSY